MKGLWCKRAFGIGFLLGVGGTIWFGYLLTVPDPGSVEEAFSRIRIGMSMDQVVTLLQSCPRDSAHYSGTTKAGRKFFNFGFADIPPLYEIDQAELYVMDDDGNEVEVLFQEKGIVKEKRWTPSGPLGETILIKVRHGLDNRVVRKALGRKAREALGL